MKKTKIFFTSFLQVGLVACNTIFLQKGIILGIFLISCLISLIWCYNVTKISVSTFKEKAVYSFGAGVGALFGYYFVNLFLKYIIL